MTPATPHVTPAAMADARPRVMILSSCVHGGGVGHSLANYLRLEGDAIDPVVVMPEPGSIAAHFPESTAVRYVPEQVERVQRGPYAIPRQLGWPWLEFASGVTAMFAACEKVTQLARRERPDVIYCNHMITKPIGAYAGRRLGIPVVFHARNVHVHPVGRRFYRGIASFETTKLVIANSEASANPYRGVPGCDVVVVPNFLDLSRFDRAVVEPRLRRAFGVADDAIVLGYLGRLVPKKGVPLMIRAFARVAPRHPRGVLALVGGDDTGQYGSRMAEYRALAAELGVGERVVFTDFQDDVRPMLADFDVNVLTSIEPESFGRVLIEAMAFGVPSIVSAHGGAVEVVRDEVDGLHVPVDDEAALAAAFGRVLADEDLRKRLGARGRRDVASRFGAREVAPRITELLTGVARRGHR